MSGIVWWRCLFLALSCGLRDTGDIELAISAFARSPNGGLIVTAGAATVRHSNLIITLAGQHRLPAVYNERSFIAAGGLISYGLDFVDIATKRTLLLTWAGIPPAGSHQLCLAHSFNYLVGAGEQGGRDFEADRLCGLKIDDKLELGGLLYW